MKTKLTFIIAAAIMVACGKPQIKFTFEGMESDNIIVVSTAIKDIPDIGGDNDPRNKVDTIKIEDNKVIILYQSLNTHLSILFLLTIIVFLQLLHQTTD